MSRVGLIFLLVSGVWADWAEQTDWSGTGGVPGPVDEWGSDYSSSEGVDPVSSPGQLLLAGQVARHQVAAGFDGAFAVHSADIDGDGDNDVLGGAWDLGAVSWWENADGCGQEWLQHPVGDLAGVRSVCPEDIDGDGAVDIAASGGSSIRWWHNADGSGTSWDEYAVSESFVGAYCVVSADLNSDGDADLAGAAFFDDRVAWWESDGSGQTWTERTVDATADGAYWVTVCDIDDDGDPDLAASLFSGMQVVWYENAEGSGTSWTKHTIAASIVDPRGLHCCDVDGDGDQDVAGTGYDELLWWENLDGGGTSWEMHPVDESFLGAHSVHGEDLDGDGDSDLLTASFNTEEILWWENLDGTGGEWGEHILSGSFEDACCVRADDLDGNGTPDPMGAAYVDDEIAWWNLQAYGGGWLESSVLDTGCGPDWESLQWSGDCPSGTDIGFQVRASNDPDQMGSWSDTLQAPGSLEGVLADGLRYAQYRAVLDSETGSGTPALDDVAIYWSPTGIEGGGPSAPGHVAVEVRPNPAASGAVVRFFVPEPMTADLRVYDISGRMVWQYREEVPDRGWQEARIRRLAPGVYLASMEAGGARAMRVFTVVG